MAAFSPDGAHFVFQDGFALTRFTLPKSLKSDRALAGTRIAVGGNIIVARRRYDRILSVNLDNLEKRPWALSDYGDYAPHPDGVHCVNVGNGAVTLTDNTTGKDSPLECPEATPMAGALPLGREWPRNQHRPHRAQVSREGVALIYRAYVPANPAHEGLLYCVDLSDPSAPVFLWQAHAKRAVGSLSLEPGRAVSFVHSYDRGLKRALIHRVDASGAAPVVETRELRSLEAPAWSGDRWAWIDDDGFVCAAPWEDFSRAERWPLPAGVDPYGTLAAHKDRVLFVPRDGERIVDVREKKIIPRKLPAGDASMRSRVAQITESFDRWLAADAGSFTFSFAARAKSGNRIEWSPEWDTGTGALSSHLAVGELLGWTKENPDGLDPLSAGGYSAAGGFRHQTIDDVRTAFSMLDKRGGKLVRACEALQWPLKQWYEPPFQDREKRGIAPPPKAFSEDAATVLLRAVFEQCAHQERVSLAPNVERWRSERWTPESLAAQSLPEDCWAHPQVLAPGVALPLAYIALDLLGAESLPVIARWLVEAPSSFASYNPHIIGDVAAAMIQYYPETEQRFVAICEANGKQGAGIMQTVRTRLR